MGHTALADYAHEHFIEPTRGSLSLAVRSLRQPFTLAMLGGTIAATHILQPGGLTEPANVVGAGAMTIGLLGISMPNPERLPTVAAAQFLMCAHLVMLAADGNYAAIPGAVIAGISALRPLGIMALNTKTSKSFVALAAIGLAMTAYAAKYPGAVQNLFEVPMAFARTTIAEGKWPLILPCLTLVLAGMADTRAKLGESRALTGAAGISQTAYYLIAAQSWYGAAGCLVSLAKLGYDSIRDRFAPGA